MNKNLANALAANIVNGAFEFMAAKAGVSVKEITAVIVADPNGNAARYFRDLLRAGIDASPAILAEVWEKVNGSI